MSGDAKLNERGNHQGEFTQGVGGWAEYTVNLTLTDDKVRHDVTVPPGKVIPVIFLPGVMGSNLRMSKARQEKLEKDDNRAWRPDDMLTVAGQTKVLTHTGYGGWYRDATPAQRQLIFDPNETEVEYYHYTENKSRFDPDGKETRESDARHRNVPDSLAPIPPLLGQPASMPMGSSPVAKSQPAGRGTPAQVARWRGWSEVLFDGAYGEMLKTIEKYMNNMRTQNRIHPFWQVMPTHADGKPMLAVANRTLTGLHMKPPQAFGGMSGEALSEADIRKVAPCWYPVHAMGYNFLKSNGESARAIAERIKGLVKGYQQRGFKCDEVIVVTHSMGGLVGRALLHPDYGNLLNDSTVKILGMYHNVMPTTGAAAAYKRMRFGFKDGDQLDAGIKASVIAIDGENATAILANAPGALELLPGGAYGKDWLKVIDRADRTVASWPGDEQTALESIYLKSEKAWWRLLNPSWINPARLPTRNGGGAKAAYERIARALSFVESISSTFHQNCYASYCASDKRLTYGEVVFRIIDNDIWDARDAQLPSIDSWRLLTDDGKANLTVQAGLKVLNLQLQKPTVNGDETVPATRSADRVDGRRFIHGTDGSQDYEHQASYADSQVLAAMLYSLVQIAKTAKWTS